MKKIITAIAVLVFAITIKSSAQTGGARVAMGDINFSAGKIKEGINSITKAGQGTLTFHKKGDDFSELVFVDAAGVSIKLIPTPAGTGGAAKPECKTKMPDACFGTANKSIGLCICRPGKIGKKEGYTFTFYGSGIYKWSATLQ
jgi:hypothetical protein